MSILARIYIQIYPKSLEVYSYSIRHVIKSNVTHSGSISKRFYTSETESELKDEKKERVFFKKQEIIDGFKVFDPFMNKKREERKRFARTYTKTEVDKFARYQKMSLDQDWTSVWPTNKVFNANIVPLPVRQGYVKNLNENDGLPPTQYGNTELMKIPNFLHLTPPHIKKHCAAIKKFCTPWPKEIETDEDCEKHFPVEITKSNYIYDGPSLRDNRARIITLQIKVSSLNLDERSRDKFLKLVQDRYDPKSDVLTLVADRCPYRRQNEEYAIYLLRTLYHESKVIEEWEEEITEKDSTKYIWEKTKSKENILETISKIEKKSEESIIESEKVKNYKENLSKIFDQGETKENLEAYKTSVLKILNLNSKSLKA